jgi:hypothetical protein
MTAAIELRDGRIREGQNHVEISMNQARSIRG